MTPGPPRYLLARKRRGHDGRAWREDALRHPSRRRIHEYVRQRPGCNFREVVRACGLASGNARHHLTMLERAGLVAEKRHRATLRFFDATRPLERPWRHVVALREEAMAQLYEWICANPGSPQTGILGAMAALGWPRSTTQHRLMRLVGEGLVWVFQKGRRKLHFATRPTRAPSTGLPAVTGSAGEATGAEADCASAG